MTSVEFADLDGVARRAVARYKRRCWWADAKDLYQEAWLAILRARRTFDPTVGVPLVGYAWRAVVLALSGYLWRQSAPVSAPDHDLKLLAGKHRAPIAELENHAAAQVECERAIHLRLVREIVGDVMREVEGAELAAEVLISERAPREVARERGIDPALVYQSTARARLALAEDAELWSAWRGE